MKLFFDYLQYLLVSGAIGFFSLFPRSFSFFLASAVARLLFLFPQMGRISMMNLAVVFPEKTEAERKKIAIASLRNLFLSLAEFFWSKGRKDVVESLVDCTDESWNTANAAHALDPAGAIFVTPHLGNWEFAGMTLALIFRFRLGTVVRSPRNPYLNRLISSGRMVDGVEIIYSKGAVRGMLRALKQGRSIGVLIDQNTRIRDGGSFVNFFGLPVPVSMAPAHLARMANRYVAIGATVRVGKKFRALLRPLPKTAAEYESDEELTQALMDLSMEMIREYPDQYLWMYRRFQNIPPDVSEDLRKRYPAYARVPGKKFFDRTAKYTNPE